MKYRTILFILSVLKNNFPLILLYWVAFASNLTYFVLYIRCVIYLFTLYIKRILYFIKIKNRFSLICKLDVQIMQIEIFIKITIKKIKSNIIMDTLLCIFLFPFFHFCIIKFSILIRKLFVLKEYLEEFSKKKNEQEFTDIITYLFNWNDEENRNKIST